tara:strand:- start:704 stop:1660 length:957 start_codon:yes stop_codon:yes gene_type:complete
MKKRPEQIITGYNDQKLSAGAFLISGNEETFIKNIQEKILSNIKKEKGSRVIKKNNVNLDESNTDKSQDLFSSQHKILVFENPKEVDLKYLSNIDLANNVVIISHNSLKTSSKLKKFFDTHKEFVSIACYKLSRELKSNIMNYFLQKNNFNLSRDCYWYFIDNSSDYYQLFENEIKKIFLYKNKDITLMEIKKLLSRQSSDEIDSLFFLILLSPEKIIYQTQKTIISLGDSLVLVQRIKFFLNIIYRSKNNSEAMDLFPKYMFKNNDSFLEIFKQSNPKKVLKTLSLLTKTEMLLKKHSDMYLLISQRFLLNVKKNLN